MSQKTLFIEKGPHAHVLVSPHLNKCVFVSLQICGKTMAASFLAGCYKMEARILAILGK